MSNVKSTYNFVPAPNENEVYKPDWADQISHDIPFEDGESGEIELKIIAQTPIFIRNGHAKDQEVNEFSHYYDDDGKHYFIPGSSLKGMLRSVLEIMSFSRMNTKLVSNDRYSFRDLSSATNQYMINYKEFKIKGGWLTENSDGSWKIEECDDLAFIDHVELQNKNLPFRDLFLEKAPKPDEKTAKFKYSTVPETLLKGKFTTFRKTIIPGQIRNMANYDAINGKVGTLVFTGQPAKRSEPETKKSSGKFHEFVFFDAENPNHIAVSPEMQKDFKFIYYNDDRNNISKDWKFWRDGFLSKGKKVPVFYSKDGNGKLNHFGLAYMYKLPFKNSVAQLEPLKSYKENLDLATAMFGFTDKDNGLKGRIMCADAIQSNDCEVLAPVEEILGGPKASYFPFYLKQYKEDKKSYFTYDDNNATLKGFKRYPVHQETKSGSYDQKQLENKKVFSTFRPLASDSEFTTKIRFHNLKAAEIGALLSAISFHGNQNKCFHNLGAAKSFGYGKVSIEVNSLRFTTQTITDYMSAFESEMTLFNPGWWKTAALTELFAMASNTIDFTLEYPTIENFVNYKKTKNNDRTPKEIESLEYYSEIVGENFNRNAFKSVASKNQKQDVLNFDAFDTLDKLRIEIVKHQESFDEFSQENRLIICERLKYLYQNHKDSKKKMDKENTWIMFWNAVLGAEISNNLRSELGII